MTDPKPWLGDPPGEIPEAGEHLGDSPEEISEPGKQVGDLPHQCSEAGNCPDRQPGELVVSETLTGELPLLQSSDKFCAFTQALLVGTRCGLGYQMPAFQA